jgi:hypothetical protein
MTPQEKMELKIKVSSVFRPGTPIDKQQLFAGRTDQINDVLNAALQPGRHVVMFGERGVGKTSLARHISDIVQSASDFKVLNSGTINCDHGDDFNSLWRKIFRELSFTREVNDPGFGGKSSQSQISVEAILPNRVLGPDDVRYMLKHVGEHTLIIVDEFDRLTDINSRIQMADTIKTLSDHVVNATLILVGVADAVDELIAEHRSIQRALVQVPMPRMARHELMKILTNGWNKSGMTSEAGVDDWIALLSQGLPHYTHSLGLYAAFKAIEAGRTNVTAQDVFEATRTTVEKSHTVLTDYNKAISSPQKRNLFARVLRACALANADELGYFTAAAVSIPMSAIMGKSFYIPNFSRHLANLSDSKRGSILKKTGEPRRVRFRFSDPMMQAFVIIHDYANGSLTNQLLEESRGRSKETNPDQVSS